MNLTRNRKGRAIYFASLGLKFLQRNKKCIISRNEFELANNHTNGRNNEKQSPCFARNKSNRLLAKKVK